MVPDASGVVLVSSTVFAGNVQQQLFALGSSATFDGIFGEGGSLSHLKASNRAIAKALGHGLSKMPLNDAVGFLKAIIGESAARLDKGKCSSECDLILLNKPYGEAQAIK
jgi:hypothetical protein